MVGLPSLRQRDPRNDSEHDLEWPAGFPEPARRAAIRAVSSVASRVGVAGNCPTSVYPRQRGGISGHHSHGEGFDLFIVFPFGSWYVHFLLKRFFFFFFFCFYCTNRHIRRNSPIYARRGLQTIGIRPGTG